MESEAETVVEKKAPGEQEAGSEEHPQIEEGRLESDSGLGTRDQQGFGTDAAGHSSGDTQPKKNEVATMESLIPLERLEDRIFLIRGQRVMLDADLARLYGVTTKALNQAVKRNQERFPADFIFQLSGQERDEVVTICDHLKNIKFSRVLPYAFTEHGAIMLANVLRSPMAIQASIAIVRAFIRLREILSSNKELAQKLLELEKRISTHDQAIRSLFDTIRQLMAPSPSNKGKIGFIG